MKKKSKRVPTEFENGRDRTKRLKRQRERYLKRKETETPQEREIRAQKRRAARKRLEVAKGSSTTDKLIEELSQIVPRQTTFDDIGDHPALSMQKLVGIKEEPDVFEPLMEIVPDASDTDDESDYEEEERSFHQYKLNKYKMQCLELRRKIDLADMQLQLENRRCILLEKKLELVQQEALLLETQYGIPIL